MTLLTLTYHKNKGNITHLKVRLNDTFAKMTQQKEIPFYNLAHFGRKGLDAVFAFLVLFSLGFCIISVFIPILLELFGSLPLIIQQLLPFLTAFILFILLAPAIHDRKLITFITASMHINFKLLIGGGIVFIMLLASVEGINYMILGQDYKWTFEAKNIPTLVILAIVMIPLQATTEELFIRSYVIQHLYPRFKNYWYTIIVSSLLFSVLHSSNPEMELFGHLPMFLYYFASGCALAIAALLTNGIELPVGIHLANNIYGTMLVNMEGSVLSTTSILTMNQASYLMLIFNLILVFVLFYFFLLKLGWIKSIKCLLP